MTPLAVHIVRALEGSTSYTALVAQSCIQPQESLNAKLVGLPSVTSLEMERLSRRVVSRSTRYGIGLVTINIYDEAV